MIIVSNTAVTAYASFTVSGARSSATPVPTVSVFRNGTQIKDDQNATHVGDGVFSYTLAAPDNTLEGSLVFSFFLTGSDQLVKDVEFQVDNTRYGILASLYDAMFGGTDNLYGKVFDMSNVLDDAKDNTDTLLTNLATVDNIIDDVETDVDQIETTVNSIATTQGSIPVVPTEGPFGRVVYPRGRSI